jgi:hypothetical protein
MAISGCSGIDQDFRYCYCLRCHGYYDEDESREVISHSSGHGLSLGGIGEPRQSAQSNIRMTPGFSPPKTSNWPYSSILHMSLFQAPSSDTDPTTVDHLLALPQLLHPISPSLAALHLARVRLLLSVPSTAIPGWCNVCGGLREGTFKAKRKKGSKMRAPERGVEKRGTVCSTCGISFKRGKPDLATLKGFASARKVASTRRSTRIHPNESDLIRSQALPATPAEDDPFIANPAIVSEGASSLAAPADILPSEPAASSTDPTPLISPSKLTTRPSLSYILSTDPNPPTYPEPPPPLGATSPPGKAKAGVRKKKKSGLAKLLAENKEREERDKGSGAGSWGL